jgi:hypothetical protein
VLYQHENRYLINLFTGIITFGHFKYDLKGEPLSPLKVPLQSLDPPARVAGIID